VFSPLLDFNIL